MNLSPEQRTISAQRERIEELEEALRQAQEALSPQMHFPLEWKLSPAQSRLLAALIEAPQGFISYDRAANIVISFAEDSDNPKNIVAAQTCRLRSLLKQYGIEIKTRWSQGYEMPPASKAIIRAALERRAAA